MLLLIRCTLFLLFSFHSQGATISKSCLSSAHETLYNIRSVVRDDTLREGQQPTSALLFVPRGKSVSSLSAALSIALSPPAGDGVLFLNLSDVLNLPGTVIDAALLPEADVLPGGTLTDRRLVELQKLVAEMSAMADLNEPGKRRVAVIVHDASELTFEGITRLNLLNRLLDGRSLVTDVDFRASSRSSRKAFKSGELSILVVVPWEDEEGGGETGGRTNDVTSGDAMDGDKSGDGEKLMVTEEEEGESVLQHNEKTRRSANTVAVDYLTKTWMRASEARAASKGERENRPLNLDALLGRLRSNVIVLSESLRIVEDRGDVNRVGGGGGGTEEEERKKLACRRSDLKAAAEALLTDELSYKGRGGGGGGGRRNKGNKGRSSSSNFGKNSSFFLTITAVLLSTLLIAVALYCMCCSSSQSQSTAVVEEETKKKITKKPSAAGGGGGGGIVINESSTSTIGSKKIVPKDGVEGSSKHGRGVDVEDSLGATPLLNQNEKSKNIMTDSNSHAAVRRRAKSTSDRQRKS